MVNASLTERETRVSGRKLILARGLWIGIVLLELPILCFGFPAMIFQMSLTCSDPVRISCGYYQLSPQQMAVLHSSGISLSTYIIYATVCDAIITFILLGTGLLIFWRRSDDRMGLFVSLLLITFGCTGTSLMHSDAMAVITPPEGIATVFYNIANITTTLLSLLMWPALGSFFYLFPDGRFVPRWSWLLISLFLIQFGFYLLPAPFNLDNWPGWLSALETLAVYGSAIATQIYRYFFVASPLQRQQCKWLLLGFGCTTLFLGVLFPTLGSLFPGLNATDSLMQLSNPFTFLLSYLPIPLGIGIALLRHRLWDIDILINRALVYGLLTVILALIYAALVFGTQSLLVQIIRPDNKLGVVISTLVVAILFQPLRRSIQRLIDRRFYRQKYDAARTLQEFNTTLYQEIDLPQLCERLVGVVQETMQPQHVTLWLYLPSSREPLLPPDTSID